MTTKSLKKILDGIHFGTQWNLIIGERGSGKTTALSAIYSLVRGYGRSAVVVVPTAGERTRLGQRRVFDAKDIVSPRRVLAELLGRSVGAFLIDEWDVIGREDQVRIVKAIQLLQPQYVFITVSGNRSPGADPTSLVVVPIEPMIVEVTDVGEQHVVLTPINWADKSKSKSKSKKKESK